MVKVEIGNVMLVGVAHVSPESVEEVKRAIEDFEPDIVAVELCRSRYKVLTEKERWEETSITQLIKGGKVYLLLAQTFLSSIQRRLGKEFGSEPGAELLTAINEAKKRNLGIALVDRDINITLRRAWRKMRFREKVRMTWEFMKALVGYGEEEEIDLKKLIEQDIVTAMIKELERIAPSAKEVLVDERDRYIAKKIMEESKKGKVLAVVGAGHIAGIKRHLEAGQVDVDLEELEKVPEKKVNIVKIAGYGIPVLLAFLVIWIILTQGSSSIERLLDMFLWWFLINGSLAGAGAAIARAHPLSILTAFVAAPFTSLNPAVAAGWFAGLVEAKLRMPTVRDFQELSKLETFKDLFKKRVVRLLMIVALANLGSTIGTLVAIPYVVKIGLIG